MARTIETNKKKWRVFGINLIPSDSIFIKLRDAINEGKLEQSYLQKITGHLGPILVDEKKRTLNFLSF